MVAVIVVLALIFIAFKIMFTRPTGGQILGLLLWFVVGLVILSVAWNAAVSFSSSLSPFYQALFLAVAIIAGILLLLRLFTSQATWWKLLTRLLHAVVVFPLVLPLRALWWVMRRLFWPRNRPRLERSNNLSRSWIERHPGSH